MPTLNINGKRVKVGDEFLQLSPEQQNATVEEIASKMGVQMGVQAQQPAQPAQPQPQAPQEDKGILDTIKDGMNSLPKWLWDPGRSAEENRGMIPGMVDEFTSGVVGGMGPQMHGAEAALLGKTPDGDWFNYDESMGKRYTDARDAEQAQILANRIRNPVSSAVANTAGAVLGAGKVAQGVGAAGKVIAPGVTKAIAGSSAGRLAGNVAVGAGLGATNAIGDGADVGEGLKTGALAGLGGHVAAKLVMKGGSKFAGMLRRRIPAMSQKELASAEHGAFEAFKNSGVVYTKDSSKKLFREMVDELADKGYNPAKQPNIPAVIDQMKRIADGDVVDPRGILTLRSLISGSFDPKNAKSNMLLHNLRTMVDDYAANAGNVVKNAVSGRPVADVRAAFRNLKMGIDLSHRGHKVKRVQAFLKRAENRGNTDKQIRTAMLRMLDNPRHTMGMTRAEIQALEKVAKGGAWRNIFKFGGEFAPDSKLGMITGGSIGFALGSAPAGISIMGAGMLAKKGADIAARGDVKKLQRLIRAGGLKTPLSPTQYALSSPDAQQIVGRAAALGLMPMTAQLGNQ